MDWRALDTADTPEGSDAQRDAHEDKPLHLHHPDTLDQSEDAETAEAHMPTRALVTEATLDCMPPT